jgi:alpha-methylacyl-CoA racemase
MVLADLGADVINLVHPSALDNGPAYFDPILSDPFVGARFSNIDTLMRNKRSIAVDLKTDAGRVIAHRLALESEVMMEEMRPGRLAKYGLDYESLSAVHPQLIYCSISGYGQNGPYSQRAGHDLNYSALSGAVDLIRDEAGCPVIPQNLMADYVGGGYLAVTGVLAALLARAKTGRGQHVDVGMLDGAIYTLADLMSAALNSDTPLDEWRGTLSGAQPNYRCYRCSDNLYVAVAPLERRFCQMFCDRLELGHLLPMFDNKSNWPYLIDEFRAVFATKTQQHWVALFADSDACVTPVLSPLQVARDPHVTEREMVCSENGFMQVGIAPKLSETPGAIRRAPARPGQHTIEVLKELGFDDSDIRRFEAAGAIRVT